jgi:hypothetical protein
MNANKSSKRKRSSSTYKKKSQKKYKGYPLSKKRENFIGAVTLQKGLIVSDRQMIQLKYVDTNTMELGIAGGSAISQVNTYNLNGLFDVNTSLASTAVPGFKEWGAFYRHYRVKGVKITCDVLSETPGAAIGIIMHAQPANAIVPLFTNWLAIREFESNSNTRQTTISSYDGGAAKSYLEMYVDLSALHGNKLSYETDSVFVGDFPSIGLSGSNPTSIPKLYIIAYKMDGSPAAVGFNAAVLDLKFKFYVECYDRIDLVT